MNWPQESTRRYRGIRLTRDFSVAPGGNAKWSGTLPKPNAEGSDGPFPSLVRARDYLRHYPSPGPVTVWLSGGTHVLDEALDFGPGDDLPVTWSARPGETVTISGGRRLTGWTESVQDGRRIWTATMPADLGSITQLFVNGRRAPRPLLPKQGVFTMASVPGVTLEGFMSGAPGNRFVAAPGDLDGLDLTGAEVVAYHYWNEERLPIEDFDPATRMVTCRRTSVWPLKDDAAPTYARYRVENVAAALTAPGEWHLDRTSMTVRYLPLPDENLADAIIHAPALTHLLHIRGGDGRMAGNLTFRGIRFAHTAWDHHPDRGGDKQAAISTPAAITVGQARNVAFEDCTFEHLGGWALELGPGSVACRVSGCTLTDLGGGGIKILGVQEDGPDALATRANLVADNEIADAGRVFHSAVGVLLVHTADNEIVHNHIHHLEYSGISCGWIWGYGRSQTRDNLIAANHIHHLGTGLLNDMGGIYTLGVQPGTVIRGNHIHDVRMHNYGGWAIYADEGSSHLLIEGNVCHHTDSEILQVHYGRENIVRGNLFACAGLGQISLTVFEAERSLNVVGNLILTDDTPVYTARDGEDLGKPGIWSDLNCFWDLSGSEVFSANQKRDEDCTTISTRRYSVDDMRAAGYDRHSHVVDPGCADPRNGDFTLPPDSPVLALGFVPPDISRVGTRPPDQR